MEGIFLPRWMRARLKIGAVILLLLCLGAWFRIGNHELGIAGFELPHGTATLFQEPEAGALPLLKVIQNAQKQIDAEVYLFTHVELANALAEAAGRGVKVRVLLEDKPYGGARTPKEIKEKLTSAGVEVRLCPSRFQFCHAKFMVVDDG